MKKYLKDQQGQGMSEYLILVLFIAVSSITVARTVGKTVFGKLGDINTSLQTVTEASVRESGGSKGKHSGGVGGLFGGMLGNGSGD